MKFVLLASHGPEICPTANAKVRALMVESGPEIPKVAERNGVTILAGPLVNREHTTVMVVQADKADDLDRFLAESRLPQWNSVRVLPSLTMQEVMADIDSQPVLF